jgi:hypothetical protein
MSSTAKVTAMSVECGGIFRFKVVILWENFTTDGSAG